jgi:molecular chaperone GrpE
VGESRVAAPEPAGSGEPAQPTAASRSTQPAAGEPTEGVVSESTDPAAGEPAEDAVSEPTDPAVSEPAEDAVSESTDPAVSEPVEQVAAPEPGADEATAPTTQEPTAEQAAERSATSVEAPVSGDATAAQTQQPAEAAETPAPAALVAEMEALRAEVEERTNDLKRITAEYANYRKRVDRDRSLVSEQAIASVLSALLPILDDLDRAREHGDLTGPFGAVAEQLTTTLGKFGLSAFGEKGDPFDPTRHEAVSHQTSPDVEVPTCVEVMRRGYLMNDRLLRAAMVAVASPE